MCMKSPPNLKCPGYLKSKSGLSTRRLSAKTFSISISTRRGLCIYAKTRKHTSNTQIVCNSVPIHSFDVSFDQRAVRRQHFEEHSLCCKNCGSTPNNLLSRRLLRHRITRNGHCNSFTTCRLHLVTSDNYTKVDSTPAVLNCCCSKGPAPYWSNPSFLIFDIRALWRSGLSARGPECQKLKIVG